jgi:hypothetical protein
LKFQPPQRKALSETELELALKARSTSIAESSALLLEQQKLRAEDEAALESWIDRLKSDGSAEAVRAMKIFIVDLFLAAPSDTRAELDPVFTSEIGTIGIRRPRNRGRGSIFFYFRTIVTSLILALTNLVILSWMATSFLDSVVAVTGGLVAAHAVAFILKTHKLHPLLRSESVFGGLGVYWSSGLILGTVSILYSSGYVTESVALDSGYQFSEFGVDLVVLGLAILLITQLSSTGFRKVLPGIVLFIGIGWASTNVSYQLPALGSNLSLNALWAAIAIGVTGSLVIVFGQPHEQENPSTLSFSALSSIAFSILALGFLAGVKEPNWQFLYLTAILSLLSLLALSGFDLAGNALGRFAGAAFLIGPVFAVFGDWLPGPILSMLSCAIVVIIIDQLFRRSSLHLNSLDNGYGFYSAFQFWSWCALAVAAFAGVPEVQQFWSSGLMFAGLEISFISGVLVGIVFGLIRIPVVIGQDRDIKNVESRNAESHNLLGLHS